MRAKLHALNVKLEEKGNDWRSFITGTCACMSLLIGAADSVAFDDLASD